jgi:hypothetical protein
MQAYISLQIYNSTRQCCVVSLLLQQPAINTDARGNAKLYLSTNPVVLTCYFDFQTWKSVKQLATVWTTGVRFRAEILSAISPRQILCPAQKTRWTNEPEYKTDHSYQTSDEVKCVERYLHFLVRLRGAVVRHRENLILHTVTKCVSKSFNGSIWFFSVGIDFS